MKVSDYNKNIYEKFFSDGNENLYYKAHELKIKKMIDLIDDSPKKILDLGCADGFLGKILKELYQAEVHGIDLAEKSLKIAEKRGIITKKFDLSLKKWPYKNNFFDLIIAGDVIEHIYDTEKFISECNRILKTNGQLIISTPNLNAYCNRILVLLGKMPLGLDFAANLSMYKYLPPMGHIRILNKGSLIKLIKEFDLKIEIICGGNLYVDKNIFHKNLQPFVFLINIIDNIFSKFPSLSSLLLVKSRKIN